MSNERGIAMPMALIVMMILVSLMAAFAVLATSEPEIAGNQAASAQARALAESGVERVLWALTTGETTPTAAGVIVLDANYNLPNPLPAPYDGATEVALGVGSFKVTVANGAQINEKLVTAVGFVPNAAHPMAVKKVQTVVTRLKWINPRCGLCAGGEEPPGMLTNVKVGGSATVNATATAQGSGGSAVGAGAYCAGVTPAAAVGSTGTVSMSGSPNLYAPGPLPPPAPTTLTGVAATLSASSVPGSMILTDSDMATLKSMAKMKGLYVRGTPTWDFPPTNGLIFVDTADGSVLTKDTATSLIPTVSIHGNGTWSGWLIVAGNVDISGNDAMTGLIYAQNDVTLHGSGTGGFTGAVISTNRVNTTSTNIDAQDVGNAPIVYNCPAVRDGGGLLSQNWFIKPGTYRETAGL